MCRLQTPLHAHTDRTTADRNQEQSVGWSHTRHGPMVIARAWAGHSPLHTATQGQRSTEGTVNLECHSLIRVMTHMSSWGSGADEPSKGRFRAVWKKIMY